MNTVQEYLNDPRMLNDPGMAKALEPIKEIHAIRLKLQDETAGMTESERIEFINKRGKEALARNGLSSRLKRQPYGTIADLNSGNTVSR